MILKNSLIFMSLFGIVPIPEPCLPSSLRKYKESIRIVFVIFTSINLFLYISTLGHFLIFKVRSPAVLFLSGFFFASSILRVTMYCLILAKKGKLLKLIDELEEVIEARSRSNAFIRVTYLDEILKSEAYVKRYFNYLMSIFVISSCLKISESYRAYFGSNAGPASFKLILPATWPFDWHNPYGYLALIAVHTIWILGGSSIIFSIDMIFSGICGIFRIFCVDINQELEELGTAIEMSRKNVAPHNRVDVAKRLYATVEFHSNAKQLIDRFLDIFGYVLTACFALSTPCICTSLLNLNMAVDLKKWIDVFRMCVLIGAVAFYICVLCLIGDNVTTRYQEVNEALWSCPWLEFPHKIQKTFPLILSLTQKPIYMEGFMNVRCTREVMNAIISGSFSYFSLLRGFSK